jgi:predicted secreted protein
MARPGRARLAALLLALSAGAALAGDRAVADFIGYSEDGRYFAFEEFGVQDGSGFAYSSIYIIDLPADEWVAGSPYEAMANDADWDRSLHEVRADVMTEAAAELEALQITEPAEILVMLGDGVPGEDGKAMAFANPSWGPPGSTGDGELRLSLETFPADSPQDCVGYIGEKGLGYALTYEANGQTVELHRDSGMLPNSRGCPVDYRLYAVLARFQGGSDRVAIISVYPFGFEGPDRRFLAVPLGD